MSYLVQIKLTINNMTQKISTQLAEKMIRMEQANAFSLNDKSINYNQTDFFKKMAAEDKEKFESHLRRQERLPFAFGTAIVLPLFLFSLTKIAFTGNVIAENLSEGTLGALSMFFLSVFFCSLALFAYYTISRKGLDSTFSKNSRIMENMVTSKSTIRRY